MTVSGSVGQTISLTCPLKTHIPNSYLVVYSKQWYKLISTGRSELIASSGKIGNGRYINDRLDINGSLVIKSLTVNDAGVYKCQFTGHPNYTVKLQVHGKYLSVKSIQSRHPITAWPISVSLQWRHNERDGFWVNYANILAEAMSHSK